MRLTRKRTALFVAQKFPESLAAIDEALRLDPKLVPALTLKAKLAMATTGSTWRGKVWSRRWRWIQRAQYAQFLYGLEAYLGNDMQAALPRFRKAHELNPSDPARRAVSRAHRGEPGAGRRGDGSVRRRGASGTAAGKPQAETLLPGARLLLLLGRLDDAERWVRQAVKLAPQVRDPHFELARILLRKGEPAQAAEEGETRSPCPAVL